MSAGQAEAARLPIMLAELRLPTVHRLWPAFAERADKEGWPAARFLATLVEHELAERVTRRVERHRLEARLPPEKTLATFDFAAVPKVRKAHILDQRMASALGHALVDNGYRVLFSRTVDLVQRLQVARRELALPAALAKLDKFDLLILDDISYVRKDQAETSVLFELIAERYERRSLLITANQPFSAWDSVFPDPAMTVAAIDRLIHHATIFELNVESYRRRAATRSRATTSTGDNHDDNHPEGRDAPTTPATSPSPATLS